MWMFTLKIQNTLGELFELTHDSKEFYVTSITGLTRPATTVNTTTGGVIDGTFFNSARVEQRNIVITIVINGDIEMTRQRLYRIFPVKTKCTIFFENKAKNVKIDGYVELLDGDLFTERQTIQVSIICPRPFFEDAETIVTELSQVIKEFEFPFAIEESDPIEFSEVSSSPIVEIQNTGDTVTGFRCTATALKSFSSLVITNITTGEYIGITYSFHSNDIIEICTEQGNLSATVTRSGATTSLINNLQEGSKWFRLAVGKNELTFTGGTQAVELEISFNPLHGGV